MSFATALSAANAAVIAACGESALGHALPTIAGVAADGIYSPPFQATNMANGSIEGYAPTLAVIDADAVDVVHGTVVVARSTTFYVVGIQPDGAGLTVLTLSENAES